MKKTAWFPPHIKPVRTGLYEIKIGITTHAYAYWNGKRWGFQEMRPDLAHKWKGYVSYRQDKTWRGITKETP